MGTSANLPVSQRGRELPILDLYYEIWALPVSFFLTTSFTYQPLAFFTCLFCISIFLCYLFILLSYFTCLFHLLISLTYFTYLLHLLFYLHPLLLLLTFSNLHLTPWDNLFISPWIFTSCSSVHVSPSHCPGLRRVQVQQLKPVTRFRRGLFAATNERLEMRAILAAAASA